MKILVAVDENAYSRYAVRQAARLAANTWSDVVMLAIEENRTLVSEDDLDVEFVHPKLRMLKKYRSDFIEALGPSADMYSANTEAAVVRTGDKTLEMDFSGRKKLKLRLRSGDLVKSMLAEAKADACDLIILGSGQHEGDWGRDSDVSGKVADGADCSLFVIREDQAPTRVVCCLDHADVSQDSLELVNQWVTLYGAELEVVGVLKHGELRESIEGQMQEVLDYYLRRDIRALVKVVEADALETFLESGSDSDLMALWLNHKSPLQKLLPSHRVASLVNHVTTSILILR